MNIKTLLGQLRYLAIFEGISYLLLIPTVLLKYGYEVLWPNMVVGAIHGILFLMYCLWVVFYARKKQWPILKTIICLAASLFPFATFIVDAKILKLEPTN